MYLYYACIKYDICICYVFQIRGFLDRGLMIQMTSLNNQYQQLRPVNENCKQTKRTKKTKKGQKPKLMVDRNTLHQAYYCMIETYVA